MDNFDMKKFRNPYSTMPWLSNGFEISEKGKTTLWLVP